MSILLALVVLFLPGYLLTLLLPSVSGFFKRIAFAVVGGISLAVVASYLLAVSGASLIRLFLPAMVVITAVLALFVSLRRAPFSVLFAEWRSLTRKERWFFGILAALAAGAGVFIFYPHFGYLWPVHADEWWGASAVQSLLKGRPLNTNPYTLVPSIDYKPGFTSLFAALAGVLGKDPVGVWPFLPALNVFFVSLVSSFLLYDKTRNFVAGALVPVLLVSLRSNIYVLGWWFFVPADFALLFVLFLLLSADDLFARGRPALLFALLVCAAFALVYLPFLALVLLSLLVFARRLFKKSPVLFSFAVAAGIFLLIAILLRGPYRAFWPAGTPLPLASLFAPLSATITTVGFFSFFGIVPYLVAAFGILGWWFLRKTKWGRLLLAAAVWGVADLVLFYIAHVSFIVLFQRLYYFLGAILAILAAVGIAELFARMRTKAVFKWVLVVLILGVSYWGYFTLPPYMPLYHLADPPDVAALRWLKSQQDPSLKANYVLSPAPVGTIITPLSGYQAPVNWLTPQGAGNETADSLMSTFFETQDCSVKRTIMNDLHVGIVYGYTPQNCPFLKQIYDRDGVYIYRLPWQPGR